MLRRESFTSPELVFGYDPSARAMNSAAALRVINNAREICQTGDLEIGNYHPVEEANISVVSGYEDQRRYDSSSLYMYCRIHLRGSRWLG